MWRRLIFSLLSCSGLLRLWRYVHRHDIVILMLHGVMDRHERVSWEPLRPQLSRQQLEKLLRALSRRYHFVSLQHAVDVLTGKVPVEPYSLVLTFDDGYRNNITHALPVLQRYNAPATIFIATGHVDHRKPFWWDRLDYAIQHASVDGRSIQTGYETVQLSGNNRADLRATYKHLRDVAKEVEHDDAVMVEKMESLAGSLEAESGQALSDVFEWDPWSCVLRWEDVERHANHSISFGSHTVSHVRLGLVDEKTALSQLADSKSTIEQHVRGPCRHFAYPNGSFNRRTPELVRKCGYSSAVTTIEGTNQVGDDPLLLRRFNLPTEGSTTELLARVCGLSKALAKLKNSLQRLLRVKSGCMPRVHQDDDSERV